jgi:hypothetical protein
MSFTQANTRRVRTRDVHIGGVGGFRSLFLARYSSKLAVRCPGSAATRALTKHRKVGDEEKTIPSCLDTSSLMIAPPVLLQSAFCALKKTDWPKLDRFKFFGFRHFKCSESASGFLPPTMSYVTYDVVRHARTTSYVQHTTSC